MRNYTAVWSCHFLLKLLAHNKACHHNSMQEFVQASQQANKMEHCNQKGVLK